MKIKQSHISISLLILIFSLTLVNVHFPSFNPQDQLETPKSSAGEITVVTPENITYTEPMSGYYPATYGFEDVSNGGFSPEWIDSSSASCTAKIIGLMGGHRKVYELYDNNPGGYAWIMQNWNSPREKGTVELYVRATDASVGNFIQFRNDTSPVNPLALNFGMYQNKFQYNDHGVWKDVGYDALADTWYHIRLDWETTNEGYQGLSQWKWKIEIDSIPFGPFNLTNNIIPEIFSTNTRNPLTGFYWYIDAVGYSWEPDYSIGDNLNEGLLLSYENTTNLEWEGYSLDGQANKTIMGNTTIPMPSDGFHNIQIFGNTSLGTMYESEVRQFAVDTTPPLISIDYPATVQEFSDAPAFILSITEINVAAMWYTLNGGINNPITSVLGTIDSSAWNSLPNGPITIRFYVRDIADREAFEEIIVVKIASAGLSTPPGIPGYDIIALLGVSCVVTLIILKKRTK